MVEFTLPKFARQPGKSWPNRRWRRRLPAYRWDPDAGANPRTDAYYVDHGDCRRWSSTG
jgi:succinate dehydrogenase / fumarate reductase iron-sulfur subunit